MLQLDDGPQSIQGTKMRSNRSWFWISLMFASTSVGMSRTSNADEPQDAVRLELLQTIVDEFVSITPCRGAFPKSIQMGSPNGADAEQPAHEVTISHDFSIAKYEVPQNLYEAVMGANPSRWKGPRNSA